MNWDQTLPMKGGWVLTKPHPAVCDMQGRKMQVRPLSMIYAQPGKISVKGSYLSSAFGSDAYRHFQDKRHILNLLYKERRGAKLDQFDQHTLDEARLHWQNWDLDDPDLEMTVKVQITAGELYLIPNEWAPIADIEPYLAEIGKGVTMIELGGIKNAKKHGETMHYMQSRGIPKVEAFKMIAGNINRPGIFMLESSDDVLECYGMGFN